MSRRYGTDWPVMVDVLPEAEQGDVKIRHIKVSKEEASVSMLRAAFAFGHQPGVREGDYCQLYVGGDLMMSDTFAEKRSNSGIVFNAKGHVLIAGLGMGMILIPILNNPEVKKVTVVELNQNVIDLVEPHVRKHVSAKAASKLTVIQADIFEWAPPRNTKYDTVYFDIWADISTDNLEDMKKLHRRFGRRKTKDAWMQSWMRAELQYRKSQERW